MNDFVHVQAASRVLYGNESTAWVWKTCVNFLFHTPLYITVTAYPFRGTLFLIHAKCLFTTVGVEVSSSSLPLCNACHSQVHFLFATPCCHSSHPMPMQEWHVLQEWCRAPNEKAQLGTELRVPCFMDLPPFCQILKVGPCQMKPMRPSCDRQ